MKIQSTHEIYNDRTNMTPYPAGTEFEVLSRSLFNVRVRAPNGVEHNFPQSWFLWPEGESDVRDLVFLIGVTVGLAFAMLIITLLSVFP